VTVPDADLIAERFEDHRAHLRAVAYRMLGSASEADDAVQEAWLRLSRSDAAAVDNLGGWLTTVVGRVCLDMLRARRARREDYVGTWLPEPLVVADDPGGDPAEQALLADSVGLALLVVLEALTPAERLAFVLHDMFAVPFDEIAPIVGRSSEATRQLASRARRRVRGGAPAPDADLAQQRRAVAAFLAAARAGDFEALLEVLDPEVVFRVDAGPGAERARPPVSGAAAVARQVLARGARFAPLGRPALVNGAAGIVVGPAVRPAAVVGVTVSGGRIAAIDLIVDRAKLRAISVDA
jgi:RNA polymerase sigma-70 factor (ECF subfamily)